MYKTKKTLLEYLFPPTDVPANGHVEGSHEEEKDVVTKEEETEEEKVEEKVEEVEEVKESWEIESSEEEEEESKGETN